MDHQQHIDALLERYLLLLDEYTQLRQRLSTIQSDVFHNIARANFSAERGFRYGQDHYDERMQALRRVSVETADTPRLAVGIVTPGSEDTDEEIKGTAPLSKDPLRWFGILAPQTLRSAQGRSIEAVEQVIPRIVSISVEMQHVEIEIRRARKKRDKAGAVPEQVHAGMTTSAIVEAT